MKKNFKFFGLLLTMAGIVLAGCGPKDNPSSTTGPSSNGGGVSNALKKALEADYSNMTVEGYMAYDLGMGIEEEYFQEVVYHDYTIIMPQSAEDTTYLYYHDYENESYLYFEDRGNGDAWLKKGLNDASLGLQYTYFSWTYSLQFLKAEDAVYSQGAYIISNPTVIEELNTTMFGFAWFNEIEYVMLFLTDDHITQITALCSLDNDDECVVIRMGQFGTTYFNDSSLPPAPTSANVRTYYDYTGTEPVVDKYIDSLTIQTEGNPAHDADFDIILDIEKTSAVSVTYLPTDANKKDITWHSSDETVVAIDFHSTSGWRLVKGLKAGTAEVYATAVGAEGKTITSNTLKVKVNSLAEQNKEGCVYDFTFINIANDIVIASNAINNDAPFEITSNKAGLRDGKYSDGSFEADHLVLYLDPLKVDFDKPAGSELVFNFDDQQVSSISLYYGLFYDSHKSYASKVSSAKILTSNDGETWDEIDILAEIQENASGTNKKLMEHSFAPASIVKIRLESSMVGNSYVIGLDNVAFMANEDCHMHGTGPEIVDVESITISAVSTEVKEGSTLLFGAVVSPSNASNKNVTWHSGNEEILTIDSNGKVTGVKAGETMVYALSADGLIKSNEVTVTVLPAPHMTSEYLGVFIAEVFTNSDYYEFVLRVLDTDHAQVEVADVTYNFVLDDYDEEDRFYVLKGENDISLRIKYSTYNKVMEVFGSFGGFTLGNTYTNNGEEFTPFVAATSISISFGKDDNTLVVGEKASVIATVAPSDAYYRELTRTNSNPDIADFESSDSNVLVAKQAGEVTITFTNKEGVSNSITITVLPVKQVTGLTINAPATLELGQSVELTVDIEPLDYNSVNLTWDSSDTSVATVSKNTVTGVVSLNAKSLGECTITCTDTVSGVTTSVTVEVVGVSDKLPSAMVGTWNADYDDYAVFTFEIDATGNVIWTDDIFEYEADLTLESISNNEYTFRSANDDVLVFSFDEDTDTLTVISFTDAYSGYYEFISEMVCYK